MRDNLTSSEVNNSIVCETIGCYSKVIGKITLKVGPTQTIFLFLAKIVSQGSALVTTIINKKRGMDDKYYPTTRRR